MAKLTGEQVLEMQSKGLNIDEIKTLAMQKGYEMPDNRNFIEKVAPILDMVFGGGKVGEAIGTKFAEKFSAGGQALAQQETQGILPKGTMAETFKQPSGGEIAGSALQSAALFMPVGEIAGGITTGARTLGMKTGVSALGKIGAGAVAGEAFDVAKNLQEGKTGVEALKPSAGVVIGAGIPTLGALLRAGGRSAIKVGEKIQTGVIRPTTADLSDVATIKGKTPNQTFIDNVNKYKLGGSLMQTIDKTQAKLSDLSSQLSQKIEATKTPVYLNGVYERTIKKILGNKMESFGSNKSIDSAIENLQNEIVSVSGKNGLVNLAEAQTIKRAAGHLGSWKYGMQDPESKASERVYNIFYNELKKEIENVAPAGVKEINKQLSDIIPIMNAAIRRLPVAERNRVLSLQDMMTLTGAVFEPSSLALTLTSLISKSGRAGQALRQAGIKASQATGIKTPATMLGQMGSAPVMKGAITTQSMAKEKR